MRYSLFIISGIISLLSCDQIKKKECKNIPAHNTVVKTLYDPGNNPDPGAMYPRIIQLSHYAPDKGAMLATFEQYIDTSQRPSFPIYRSTDSGKTWQSYSNVEDTKNQFGMRYQPQIFELPQQVADLPEGTILCAGSSLPKDLSTTELMLYKSNDGGKTWAFVSSIIKGGGAGPTIPGNRNVTESKDSLGKANNPVWEPFLSLDKRGRLICFYSDEGYKSKKYNQLLAHKISEDGGKTWSKPIFDVAIADGVRRPGMIVTASLPNGKYIMVYEVVGLPDNPVYCRFSDDGNNWGNPADLGTRIADSSNNFFMSGTPYIIWVPGGINGTLVVTAKGTVKNGEMTGDGMMINTNLGKGSWHYKSTIIQYDAKLHPGGYSRSMVGLTDGRKIVMLTPVPLKGNKTAIRYTVEDISE